MKITEILRRRGYTPESAKTIIFGMKQYQIQSFSDRLEKAELTAAQKYFIKRYYFDDVEFDKVIFEMESLRNTFKDFSFYKGNIGDSINSFLSYLPDAEYLNKYNHPFGRHCNLLADLDILNKYLNISNFRISSIDFSNHVSRKNGIRVFDDSLKDSIDKAIDHLDMAYKYYSPDTLVVKYITKKYYIEHLSIGEIYLTVFSPIMWHVSELNEKIKFEDEKFAMIARVLIISLLAIIVYCSESNGEYRPILDYGCLIAPGYVGYGCDTINENIRRLGLDLKILETPSNIDWYEGLKWSDVEEFENEYSNSVAYH